jgi:aquaporin Z
VTFAVLLQLGLSVGNLPFNPARAIGSAVFSSGWALEQLWVFVAAPLVGAVIAGLAFRSFGAGPAASGETPVAGADDDSEGPADELTEDTVEEPAAKATKNEASEAQEFFDGRRG